MGLDEFPDRCLRAQVPTEDAPHHLEACRVAQELWDDELWNRKVYDYYKQPYWRE